MLMFNRLISTAIQCHKVAFFFALLTLAGSAQATSVAISDNLLVLSDRERSGEIELLSMQPVPAEFTVTAADLPDEVLDGNAHVRWAPQRTQIPGNRSQPLRVVFRPPADLAPGEYVVQLNVMSREVNPPPLSDSLQGDGGSAANGMAAGVAIQPVLPVTIYLRHKVESPAIEIVPFEAATNDPQSHGDFTVRKAPEDISFVGTVAVVGEQSGRTFSSGRLRVGQTINEMRVSVPRRADEPPLDEAVCLKVWPRFPAEGSPEQTVCGR